MSRVEKKVWFDDCWVVRSVVSFSVTEDVNGITWLTEDSPVIIKPVDSWPCVLNVELGKFVTVEIILFLFVDKLE